MLLRVVRHTHLHVIAMDGVSAIVHVHVAVAVNLYVKAYRVVDVVLDCDGDLNVDGPSVRSTSPLPSNSTSKPTGS